MKLKSYQNSSLQKQCIRVMNKIQTSFMMIAEVFAIILVLYKYLN